MGSKDASQKMQFLGTTKKLASLFPRLQNAKRRKTPTDLTVNETKIGPIPNVLAYSTWRAHEQGQICRGTYGFMSKMCLGKKFLRF
jgi:hypothetical protein